MPRTFQGYLFPNNAEYARAKKEWELIGTLRKEKDLRNPKVAIQLYEKAIASHTFRTVVGYSFLKELQDAAVGPGGVKDVEALKPIELSKEVGGREAMDAQELKKYKLLYGKSASDVKRFKVVIGFFVVLVLGIIFITYRTQYSVFTYFKDYEAEIENRVIEEYGEWEARLDERERALGEGGE